MIIFYDKKTGEIVGTIDGRIHSEEHLKMWVGDKKETDRIVVNYKITKKEPYFEEVETYKETGCVDEDGEDMYIKVMKKVKRFNVTWEPDHQQKDLFVQLDKKPSDIYNYKVDLKTKLLVSKPA